MFHSRAVQRTAYPPPPWRLQGELVGALWLILPRPVLLPKGWRPVTVFGRMIVGAVWASYGPDGDLAYRELAAAVLVRKGLRLAVTVPWIWVDSAASRAGGRALWSIPKEVALFDGLTARDLDGRWIASAETTGWSWLPGRWLFRLRTVQPAGDRVSETPARIVGRLAFGRSRWRMAAPMPLLNRPPLITARLDRASLRFGRSLAERPR
jgi:hypothetical protein